VNRVCQDVIAVLLPQQDGDIRVPPSLK